jgi:hypothetical protein
MVEFPQDLSLQDLRAIIHGLKMAGFTSVDEGAADHIKFRINSLPSAEALSQISQNPKAFRDIIVEVGEIMRIVEAYSKQGSEYSARFKSKKKLPPRYKVLEWRKDMKNEKEIQNDKKAAVVTFVKMSSDMDNIGHGIISGKLLKCASSIQSESYSQQEVDDVVTLLKNAGLENEAIKVATIGGFLGGIGNVFKNVWQKGVAGGLEGDFNDIARRIERVYGKMQKLTADSQKSNNPQVTQQMKHLMSAIVSASQGWNKVINEARGDAGETGGGAGGGAGGGTGAGGGAGGGTGAGGGAGGGAGAGTTHPKVDDADIDELIAMASTNKRFYRISAMTPETKKYYEDLKANNPEEFKKAIEEAKKRKSISSGGTVTPSATTSATTSPSVGATKEPSPSPESKATAPTAPDSGSSGADAGAPEGALPSPSTATEPEGVQKAKAFISSIKAMDLQPVMKNDKTDAEPEQYVDSKNPKNKYKITQIASSKKWIRIV